MKTKSEFLSEAMIKLLNYRVEQEEFSSRLYLAMSTWLDDKGFAGASKLFKQYSDEETIHATKAKNMLSANGIRPITPALKQPKQDFLSLADVIIAAMEHEKEITRQCYALTKMAHIEENYMVVELGLWYSKEQAEELNKVQYLLDRLEAFGEEPSMLRELDEEMGELAA
ncbi:ferritin [Bizionia gelidisalsuginis]|uniref:Ferritin n=1 Tax=Bizionia gelidisalsuginis TaxID=291188 RepID=A0ABY3M8L2_9FLAO|nr:ferritin [Bizionia gelidisalsuginis]TYC10586.1 ferritin [Bizionia gelidisalsuginis]